MAILKSKALILTLFLFSTLTFAIRSPLPEASPSNDLIELLKAAGLPPGLFPDTVYRVRAGNNGTLTVKLHEDCYVLTPSGKHFHYQPTITMVIKPGAINNLIGVQMHLASGWEVVTNLTYSSPYDFAMTFTLENVYPVQLLPKTDFAFVPTCLTIRSVTDAEV